MRRPIDRMFLAGLLCAAVLTTSACNTDDVTGGTTIDSSSEESDRVTATMSAGPFHPDPVVSGHTALVSR